MTPTIRTYWDVIGIYAHVSFMEIAGGK